MNGLSGKKIALLEARLSGELAKLIERHGGAAFCFPALREAVIDSGPEVARLLDKLASGDIQYAVFQTGVGLVALITEAGKLGRHGELLAALGNVEKICRGPKPTAVLARHGLKPDVSAGEPFTTTELLEAMSELELKDRGVAVLHYGERNLLLAETLKARGAVLEELCLYEWMMPEDLSPLKNLVGRLEQNFFDAVVFTSQIQARHLFEIARDSGKEKLLIDLLNNKTVTASIGPTCSAALRDLGVVPTVEPENPKMGPLVLALVKHFESSGL